MSSAGPVGPPVESEPTGFLRTDRHSGSAIRVSHERSGRLPPRPKKTTRVTSPALTTHFIGSQPYPVALLVDSSDQPLFAEIKRPPKYCQTEYQTEFWPARVILVPAVLTRFVVGGQYTLNSPAGPQLEAVDHESHAAPSVLHSKIT